MNTQNLVLDVSKESTQQQVVTIGQGDKAATTIRATVYDNGMLLSGSYTARFCMRLPGKADYFTASAGNVSNGVVTYQVDEAHAGAKAGFTDECYFEILQGSAVIASTNRFAMRILRNVEDGAELTPEWKTDVQAAIDAAEEAAEEARQAAAAAHGMPTGGAAGQVLQKLSGTDYDASWASVGKDNATLSDISITANTGFAVSITEATFIDHIAFLTISVTTESALNANSFNECATVTGIKYGFMDFLTTRAAINASGKLVFTRNTILPANATINLYLIALVE